MLEFGFDSWKIFLNYIYLYWNLSFMLFFKGQRQFPWSVPSPSGTTATWLQAEHGPTRKRLPRCAIVVLWSRNSSWHHCHLCVCVCLCVGQSSLSSTNSHDKDLQPLSCRSGPRWSPSSSDRSFAIRTDSHPNPCVGRFQHQSPIGSNHNKARFLAPPPHGNSGFVNNVAGVQSPVSGDLHSPEVPGPGLGGLMRNITMGWSSSNKQATAGPAVRRPPNPLQSQGTQLDLLNHLYPQRHIGPPNQVAPDSGMLAQNHSIRDTAPRPGQPMMGSPSAVVNLNQASPEQRVPAGNFSESSPAVSSYHNNRANHLTFDFLPEGDNTVPGINTDSDFIDSLLKSGSGNDDWMKDINLDEILGSHS